MKNEYQNDIIGRMRKLRGEYGYSQSKIAYLLGISNGQMGNIESPKAPHKYTLAQIQKICRELNFPIEQVFLDDGDYAKNMDLISILIEKIVEYEG